jgi:hypothetical protein
MRICASIILLALALTQAGCKTDLTTTLITSLGAVSSSSSVAIAVVSSLENGGQISGETARQIIAYAQAVSELCAKSVATLNSGGTSTAKALSILSAVAEVQSPLVATYGDAKAKAVVAALEAALAALRVQLQFAAKVAKASNARVSPSAAQSTEIRRIGLEAEAAALAASRWEQTHPALLAAR